MAYPSPLRRIAWLIAILWGHAMAQGQCEHSEYLETVRVNGTMTLICRNHSDEEAASPIHPDPKHPVLSHPKPAVYPKKDHNLYLYDLSVRGQMLDLAPYRHVRLLGTIPPGTRFAFADETRYRSESNVAALRTPDGLDLHALWDRLDLRRLKYLVAFVPHGRSLTLEAIRFIRDAPPKPRSFPLSVWVWRTDPFDATALSNPALHTLYVQMAPQTATVIQKAQHRGKKVFGLDGDPHDILDPARLLGDIRTLRDLKRTFPKTILGFQIDVEPYLLPDYTAHTTQYLTRYLTLVRRLSDKAHEAGLLFSVAIPFWFDNLYVEGKPLAFHVVDAADEVVLMNYRRDRETAMAIAADTLAYGQYRHTTVKLGIELTPIPDEKHTLYRLAPPAPCLIRDTIKKQCRLLTSVHTYTVWGKTISFNGAKDWMLNDFISQPVDYRAFGGFVLHDYSALLRRSSNAPTRKTHE